MSGWFRAERIDGDVVLTMPDWIAEALPGALRHYNQLRVKESLVLDTAWDEAADVLDATLWRQEVTPK